MLAFPQLQSGCLAQYPVRIAQSLRTIVNVAIDGSTFKCADPDGGTIAWNLEYSQLSDEEATALSGFFQQTEGRLTSFLFADPTQNLLASSSDLLGNVWVVDPMIRINGNVADAFGGVAAFSVSNSGASSQRIAQTIDAPGNWQYCLSAYIRSDSGASCTLTVETADVKQSNSVIASHEWMRCWLSPKAAASGEWVRFVLELPASASVEVCGIQVDAQPAPSTYKASGRGGLYPDTRFDTDVLSICAEGFNSNSVTFRLLSKSRG